jgi:AraC family transcriptional regulator of arabinose operon
MDAIGFYLYFLPMFRARHLSPKPLFHMRDLSIRGIGIREAMPACVVERPAGTGDFLFMLFHDAVILGLKGETRGVPPGTMMFWACGASHLYGSPKHGWTHSWIHCTGPAVRRELRRARLRLNEPLHLPDPARIERLLLGIYEELMGRVKRDAIIVANTFTNLIREAARSRDPLRAPPIAAEMARAREILDTRYHEPMTLTMLAREVGLSQSHFCEGFCRAFGFPPMTYLRQRRMRVAALLLADTTEPVGEIGRRVGYPDPFYFSRCFKTVHGAPPSRFRKG